MKPEDRLKYKRPTTAVRVRPYLFLYQTSNVLLRPGGGAAQPALRFLPQGNAAEGNRVTWGWWIRIFLQQGSARILFNGITVNITQPETTLIDSTKNAAGIDVSEYSVTFLAGDQINVFAIEQILQISEL
jgi:hypothetical protein